MGIKNEVMTEERLDWLAMRFHAARVYEVTGVSFAWFLRDPEHYESLAVQLAAELKRRRRALRRPKVIYSEEGWVSYGQNDGTRVLVSTPN